MRRCCETTSCCQACESPATHWRTSLATASCAASCSGVRSNVAPKGFDSGRSVPRGAEEGASVCGSGAGMGPDRATVLRDNEFRGEVRVTGFVRPICRPAVGIAMCRTPMFSLYVWAFRVVQRQVTENLGGWGGDDAAGDAVARVAGGVCLHVVGLLVDHDGGAPVGKDGVGRGGVQGKVVDLVCGLARMVFADGDVLGHVTVVVAHW